MLKVLTSNNTAIFRELRTPAFQALEVQHVVVTDGAEALDRIRAERPALAILDVDLPSLSGYDVCARVKADGELKGTRLILVLTGSPGPAEVDRLAACGCDDIMTIPVPADDLYSHAARLLNLPQRHRAMIRAQVLLPEGSRTPVVRGEALAIQKDSIDVAVEIAVELGTDVRVRLACAGHGQAVVVKGKVVAQETTKDLVRTLRIKLGAMRPEDERALADLALWQVVEKKDGLVVFVRGDITEYTEFGPLRAQLETAHNVTFDTNGIRYINSAGIRKWVELVRALPADLRYTFVRCSVAFLNQLGMVSDAMGTGTVISFMAPYRCDTCDKQSDYLLQTASLVVPEGETVPTPPAFDCPQCGSPLDLDDVPERYFSFLR